MSTPYEIPLTAEAQQFTIAMVGKSYWLVVRWCPPALAWTLDINDADRNPLVTGLHLVTGADLLAQFGYLGFGGELRVQTDHDLDTPPTATNLGDTSHAYFIVS